MLKGVSFHRFLGAIGLAGSVVCATSAWASEVVVMDVSGGAPYRGGDVIMQTEPIELLDGESLFVISSVGEKIRIDGPFVGALIDWSDEGIGGDAAASSGPGINTNIDLVSSLAKLFKTQMASASSIGAFRSVGTAYPSSPWVYNVAGSGTYCYGAGQSLGLWRQTAAEGGDVQLGRSGASVSVSWSAGQRDLQWPVDVVAGDNQTYQLNVPGQSEKSLTLREVPPDLPTRMHMAAWMSERNCDEQAMLLVVNAEVDTMLEGLVKSGQF